MSMYSFKAMPWLTFGELSGEAVKQDGTYESKVWQWTYKTCHIFIAHIDTSLGYRCYLLWCADMTTAWTDGTDGNFVCALVCVLFCDCAHVRVNESPTVCMLACVLYRVLQRQVLSIDTAVLPVRTDYEKRSGFALERLYEMCGVYLLAHMSYLFRQMAHTQICIEIMHI